MRDRDEAKRSAGLAQVFFGSAYRAELESRVAQPEDHLLEEPDVLATEVLRSASNDNIGTTAEIERLFDAAIVNRRGRARR